MVRGSTGFEFQPAELPGLYRCVGTATGREPGPKDCFTSTSHKYLNKEGNKMKLTRGVITFLILTMAVAGLIIGCAGSKPTLTSDSMPDTFPCVDDDGKIEQMIAQEAELAEFSCSVKTWDPALQCGCKEYQRSSATLPGQYISGQRQSCGRSHTPENQKRLGGAGPDRILCLSRQGRECQTAGNHSQNRCLGALVHGCRRTIQGICKRRF